MSASAEKDEKGSEYLEGESWSRMGVANSSSSRASQYADRMMRRVTGGLEGPDLIKVCWLSGTLFFIVGGYWLLRSLKDPIMSVINGVEYIPQAKIASLFVVFGLVIVYNKLLDMFPKHQLFYMMGLAYGVLFGIMGLLLLHPTIGLSNSNASPYRFLGWLSYVSIESFGSMVVQCYWALVNSSVDTAFAKKNFGLIVAGAQIGSILGPTVATQASVVGVPALYLLGAVIMFCMVGAMYLYIAQFGLAIEGEKGLTNSKSNSLPVSKNVPKKKEEAGGIMEGFTLFMENDFVKGIFCISSLSMVQVTILDYTMKVLVKHRYEQMYPGDPQAAVRAFASFMGYFGQMTNSISFVFSLFGTGMVIKRFGLTNTMISYPVLLLVCALAVWINPSLWCVFVVMMVIKGMSYALNNPCKEILYQVTSTNIKFKCKSWIDTFGQRSSKAAGSLVTNAFATSLPDLINYGSLSGVIISVGLVWVSQFMGKEFEERSISGIKVGEDPKDGAGASRGMDAAGAVHEYSSIEMSEKAVDEEDGGRDDASCGLAEEGQEIGESNSSSGSPRAASAEAAVVEAETPRAPAGTAKAKISVMV